MIVSPSAYRGFGLCVWLPLHTIQSCVPFRCRKLQGERREVCVGWWWRTDLKSRLNNRVCFHFLSVCSDEVSQAECVCMFCGDRKNEFLWELKIRSSLCVTVIFLVFQWERSEQWLLQQFFWSRGKTRVINCVWWNIVRELRNKASRSPLASVSSFAHFTFSSSPAFSFSSLLHLRWV